MIERVHISEDKSFGLGTGNPWRYVISTPRPMNIVEQLYIANVASLFLSNGVDPAGFWISVNDRLPEAGKRVLVALVNELDGHRMKRPELGYTVDGKTWYIDTWKEWAVDSDMEVTHWMELPEVPAEVNVG